MIDWVNTSWGTVGLAIGLIVGWLVSRLYYQSTVQRRELQSQHEGALSNQSLMQAQQQLQQTQQVLAQREQEAKQAQGKLSEAEHLLVQAQEQLKQSALIQQSLEKSEQRVEALQSELTVQHGQAKDLKARLDAANRETEEKVKLLQEAKDQMRLEFQSIAQKLFEDKSQKFTDQNKTHLGEILTPLKEQLSDFKKKVEDVYDKESRDRVSLLQEIVSLKELNTRMSVDALNLTRALKGDNKAQGNWGEMVLEKVLEASGLQKGREYETQGSYINESGQRLRPDVVVHLPDHKQVIIDSKVSLVAWERFCSETEEDKELHLKQHLESIRQHIKELSAKDYANLYGINTPDYVLMFIPIEPAFLKALEIDSELFGYAFDENIMLVCPSTLMVTLKTIHSIWRYEYQNRNAIEIARQAGALHDQFVLFLESIDDIGDKLDKAQEAYTTARKRLKSGRGNLVRRVEQLEVLGAKTKRAMQNDWLEDDSFETEPAESESNDSA